MEHGTFHCAECNGTRLYVNRWRKVNSESTGPDELDGPTEDTYCLDCDDTVRVAEFVRDAHGALTGRK